MGRKLGRDLNSGLLTPSPEALCSLLSQRAVESGCTWGRGGGIPGALPVPFPVLLPGTCFQVGGAESEPGFRNLIPLAGLLADILVS